MKFAEKFSRFIVNQRWYFFGLFIALTIACIVLSSFVNVNYDLTKYLPKDSNTKIAIDVMTDEFGSSGMASIMIENVTDLEVINELIAKIEKVDGVASVLFDESSLSYYNNNNALLKVFFSNGDYTQETEKALNDIQNVCADYQTSFAGSAVESTTMRNALGTEMYIILIVAVVIVILILLLTSRSWFEPIIYLIVIGCAIAINMGSNLILGEISFVTQSISAIMLIALVMDYCIVLCSRFREESAKGMPPKEAMISALSGSFKAILACSLTVIMGLIALVFMDFSIGFDIGMVLAKGVALSILAVLFFMPSIILLFSNLLKKTEHKFLLPKMDKVAHFATKSKWVMPLVFVCVVGCAIVVQTNVQFTYIAENSSKSSYSQQVTKIEDNFGKQNTLVVMLPKGDIENEKLIADEIMNIEVEGNKYINSASGIVLTQLYVPLTSTQIQSTFALSEDMVNLIFSTLGKNPNTDTIYTAELLELLHKYSNIVEGMFAQKQEDINSTYSTFASYGLYELKTYPQAQQAYGVSDANTIINIYAKLLGVPTEEINEQTVLPSWIILQTLYSLNPDAYSGTNVENLIQSQAFNDLTINEIIENYSLPQSIVENIFSELGVDKLGNIKLLQLIQVLNAKDNNSMTIIDNYEQTILNTINNGYNDYLLAQESYLSENYSRLIFNLNLGEDDPKAITFINSLNNILSNSSYEKYYIVNNTQNVIDTMNTFETDKLRTDLITILGVFVLIMLMFRSISVPLILVLTIQGAIWCNLAISAIAGQEIYFICYLLAMAIQMGATIDYGILLTDRYIEFRRRMNKTEALKNALNTSFPTIITSGSILVVAAYSIHFISSTPLIAEIGSLIGKGALISVIVVLFVLPQLLLLFDKFIEKTTLKQKFYKDSKHLQNKIKNNVDTTKDNIQDSQVNENKITDTTNT